MEHREKEIKIGTISTVTVVTCTDAQTLNILNNNNNNDNNNNNVTERSFPSEATSLSATSTMK